MTELKRTAEESAELWREVAEWYQHQLCCPPEGWFTFGTHIDPETGRAMDVQLEFWGIDDGGLPIWERPVRETSDD